MGAGRHGHSHEKSNHKSNHGHSHSGENHSHDNRKKFLGCCYCSNTLRLGCMLSMTFVYFLVELIVGQITNSITLTADSFHMLSDALALLIGLFTVIVMKTYSFFVVHLFWLIAYFQISSRYLNVKQLKILSVGCVPKCWVH